MEPGRGFIDVEDTIELVRDAQRGGHMDGPNGTMTEALTITERTQATAQAALQPFSYDMHVKLGMELLALRRQEKLMALDAEAFGEKLKRRAMMRDVLKQVAKDENWVQYPTSDLERYRALGDGEVGNEEDEEGDTPDKRGSGEPSAAYAKWLERRRRGAERRAAFGTTAARDVWLYSNGQPRPSDTGPSARASRSGDSFGPQSGGSYVFGRATRFPLPPPAAGPPRRSSSSTNTHTRAERTAGGGSASVTTITIDGSIVVTNTAGDATDAQRPPGSSPPNEPGPQRTRQRPRASFAGDVLDEEEWRAQKRLSRAAGGDGGSDDGGGSRTLGITDYEAFAAEDSEGADDDAGAGGRGQRRAGGVTEEDLDYAAAMLGLGGGEGLRHVDMARMVGGGRRDSALAGSFGGLRGARSGQSVLFKMKTGLVAAAADSAVGSFSLGLPLPAMPPQRAKSVHHVGGGGGGFNWREAMRTKSVTGSSMLSSQLVTASGEVQEAGGSLAGLLSDLGLSGDDTAREQKARQQQKQVDTARHVLALEEAVRSVSAITDDQLSAFVKAVQATQAAAVAAAKAAAVEAASAPPPRTPPAAPPRTPAGGGEADGAPGTTTAGAQGEQQEQKGPESIAAPLEGSDGPGAAAGAEQGDTDEARAVREAEVAAARAAATSAAAATAAAHVSVMMYAEAAAAVDSLAVAAEDELEYAVDEYASAHGRRMKAIEALQDRSAEVERLQAWRAEEEQARVGAVVAALQQQCERMERIAALAQEGKVKGKGKAEATAEKDGEEGEEEEVKEEKEVPSSASPAVVQLSQRCAAAAELLTELRESIAMAEQMAGLREMERERRREALRMIEEECVRLAEEMAEQEETERLAAVMAAEAEAQRLMEAAETEEEVKRHALMAAILMGVEEWVLEKEARQAALRAAERDESRLRALVGAEVDKARQAAEEGAPPPNGELLAELRELHGQAADELALRRRLYNKAVEELARLEALRQAELDKAALREHGEAEGAAAAAAVRAMAAESAIDHVKVPESKADEEDGGVQALLAAAVRAVEGFCGVAERRQNGAGAEAGTEAGTGAEAGASSSSGPVELEQNGEGKEGKEEKEDELQRWSREAKERIAAACAALSAVRALREQMQATSADLAEMKQEVAAEAEARAAVAEEQRRVAALAEAEADAQRQAWLQEVLDECNRLYDLLAAGEAAQEPEPQDSEQPTLEAAVELPEQPEVQVLVAVEPPPPPPSPPPPAPVAAPTKGKALGGPATVTLGFDSAPGRSTAHVPMANPLHRHYQHQHQQLHNASGAAFLVQNSRTLPYGKAPNAPPVLASLQTHGLPPTGQDAAGSPGVVGHPSAGIANSPSGHNPSGMAAQRRSYIAHGMQPGHTHMAGPHGEHVLPPISAHALLPVAPASPLPGPADPLRPGSGGAWRPGRTSPRACLAAEDLLYGGASEGSHDRRSPVPLQVPAAATAAAAISPPSPGRGGGLLSPHSSSVRPNSDRAVSMQVLVPRLPQCGTAHESPMHQQLLRRQQQQQQQHGEDPTFILEPSHSYSASNTPTRNQAHPHLGRRSQPGTMPAAANASGGGFSLPTLPLNMSYSQWVAQHDASARAMEAARQVDEVLSRLPPELHSVLLGAADLLQGVNAAVQLQAHESVEGPSQLAALPPVVAKYIMGQLQRIYAGPRQQPAPQQQLQDAGEDREEEQRALQHIQQHGGLTASPSTLQVLGSCLPGVAHSLAAVKGRLPGGHLPSGLCLDVQATPGALGFQGGALRSRKAGSADPSRAQGGRGRLRRMGSGGKGGGAARAEYELLKAQHDALGVERWTLRGVNVQLPRQGGGAAGGGLGGGLSALPGLSGSSGTYPQHRDAFLPPLNNKYSGLGAARH